MPMISLFKLVLVYKANGNDGEIGGGGGGGGENYVQYFMITFFLLSFSLPLAFFFF